MRSLASAPPRSSRKLVSELNIINILDLHISIIKGSKLRKFKRKAYASIVLGLRNSYEALDHDRTNKLLSK
jgi:hypothetical protein